MKYEPPHSIEAEQALLGVMLLDTRVAIQATEELRTEDFYREQHKLIFGAVQEIVEKQQELNLVTLIDTLKLKGQLEAAGDMMYITQLSRAGPLVPAGRNMPALCTNTLPKGCWLILVAPWLFVR